MSISKCDDDNFASELRSIVQKFKLKERTFLYIVLATSLVFDAYVQFYQVRGVLMECVRHLHGQGQGDKVSILIESRWIDGDEPEN